MRDVAYSLMGLGAVAGARQRPERAARLFGVAEALREAISHPLPPVNRLDYERAVAAARAQLDTAAFVVAWAEGRAMTLEQAVALALEVAAEVPPPAPAPPATPKPTAGAAEYPAGLTGREVEVLRLVAQGLTDAQVAARLIVSAHTVHAHLRAIYGKLAVSSRAAATRFAVDHHLI